MCTTRTSHRCACVIESSADVRVLSRSRNLIDCANKTSPLKSVVRRLLSKAARRAIKHQANIKNHRVSSKQGKKWRWHEHAAFPLFLPLCASAAIQLMQINRWAMRLRRLRATTAMGIAAQLQLLRENVLEKSVQQSNAALRNNYFNEREWASPTRSIAALTRFYIKCDKCWPDSALHISHGTCTTQASRPAQPWAWAALPTLA